MCSAIRTDSLAWLEKMLHVLKARQAFIPTLNEFSLIFILNFFPDFSLKLKMKTNGVEKNSEDNHLNKIKIKVKKKRLEKKCDHKSFSTSSGFVFTYQDLFLPM